MPPLVSILIPAYNAEAWIGPALKSALQQTWGRKEVIVVDDGSADQTLSVARTFESSIVKVTTQENLGASAARNHALSLCQGDYIQWLDADDLLAPTKIAHQMEFACRVSNPKILLSSAWGTFYTDPQESQFRPNALWRNLPPADWLITAMEQNAWMAIDSWLISRTLTGAAGKWNEALVRDNDGEYLSRVIRASEGVHFVNERLSYIRRGISSSISSDYNLSDLKVASLFKAITLQISNLRLLEDTERSRRASLKYLQRHMIYFYPEHQDLLEQACQLAISLGGLLQPPDINWKYGIIRSIFGWSAAKKAMSVFPRMRAKARLFNRAR